MLPGSSHTSLLFVRIFFPNLCQVKLRIQHPYLLLVLAMLFWSGNFVISKAVSTEVPPVALAFWRWCLAAIFITLYTWKQLKKDLPAIQRHWKVLLPISVLGITCFNTLIYIGLQNTSAINSLLLQSFFPIVVAIFSFVFFKEKLRWMQILGIIISLSGTLFLISRGSLTMLLSAQFNPGDIWICLAVCTYAGYASLLRFRPEIHPLSFLTITFMIGVVVLFPFYLLESVFFTPVRLSYPFVFSVLYLAIFPSILAYLAFNEAVKMIGPNVAGLFSHLMPVFGSILAMIFLGERFQTFHTFGILLIFTGIMLVIRYKSAAPPIKYRRHSKNKV